MNLCEWGCRGPQHLWRVLSSSSGRCRFGYRPRTIPGSVNCPAGGGTSVYRRSSSSRWSHEASTELRSNSLTLHAGMPRAVAQPLATGRCATKPPTFPTDGNKPRPAAKALLCTTMTTEMISVRSFIPWNWRGGPEAMWGSGPPDEDPFLLGCFILTFFLRSQNGQPIQVPV